MDTEVKRSVYELLSFIYRKARSRKGNPVSLYCKEHGYGQDQLLEWVRRYDEQGEAGLKRHKPYKLISCEERERLVRLYLEKDVPLREIYTSADISRTNLQTWIRLVCTRGYGALYDVRSRGRKPKNMDSQKKYEPQGELERLQAENLRLRAENALLKKAKALMEEEESRLRGSGRRPSKH